MFCIFCPNLAVLSWTGDELQWGQIQNEGMSDFKIKFDLSWISRSINHKISRDLNQGLLFEFVVLIFNIWWVSEPMCNMHTQRPTVGNDNTQRPKLVSGKNQLNLHFKSLADIFSFAYALLWWLHGTEMGVFYIPVADEPIRMRCVCWSHLQNMEWRLVSIWIQETKVLSFWRESQREIQLIGLFEDRGHQGPYNPYKSFNHNLYIGIIIFPHSDNPQLQVIINLRKKQLN